MRKKTLSDLIQNREKFSDFQKNLEKMRQKLKPKQTEMGKLCPDKENIQKR